MWGNICSYKVNPVVLMEVGDGLNQDDSDEEGEEWLNSRYVVKV